MSFHKTEELIEDIRQGKMVVLIDDEDRENEGDLVLAADHVTPQAINFMAMEARGLICLALSSQQVEKLNLPLMVRDDLNYSPNKTAFTVSIEAASGVTTGISAADRAHTIRVAAHPQAQPEDVHTPGHIFPIRAQQGGVLKRAGHTEGSVDLAKLAGLHAAAVICEVMNPDGTMARVGDLKKFAQKHNLKIGTIVDLIQYRLQHETLIEEVTSFDLPSIYGNAFKARIFRSKIDQTEHLILQKGEINEKEPTLVRVHVDHFVRDLFMGMRFENTGLLQSIQAIEKAGAGVLILLRGNNRPTISAELKSMFTSEAAKPLMDERDYGIGAQILRQLGVHRLKLLTNKPERKIGLKAFDLEIVEIVPLDVDKSTHEENNLELDTKKVENEKNKSGRRHQSLQ